MCCTAGRGSERTVGQRIVYRWVAYFVAGWEWVDVVWVRWLFVCLFVCFGWVEGGVWGGSGVHKWLMGSIGFDVDWIRCGWRCCGGYVCVDREVWGLGRWLLERGSEVVCVGFLGRLKGLGLGCLAGEGGGLCCILFGCYRS